MDLHGCERWAEIACVLGVVAAWPASAAAQTSAPKPRLVLLPTHTHEVDPIAGRFVDRALTRRAEAAGFTGLSGEPVAAALHALDAEDPPSMADLWRVTSQLHAQHGVFAWVWAAEGRYVVQVRVANADGRGPFYAQADASNAGLEAAAAALFDRALADARSTPAAPAIEQPAGPASGAKQAGPEHQPNASAAATRMRPGRPASEAPLVRFALRDDLALGVAGPGFVAELVGARVDLRAEAGTWLGGQLSYANLPGRHARAQSALALAQVEQRIAVVANAVELPLKLGIGYLARNGAVLRLSSGISFAFGEKLQLGLDLLSPMFWVTPRGTLFSLDFGAELMTFF